jgi:preprotein translocase SecE subunit
MSDKQKKQNIVVRFFKAIARRFVEVRQELKRVIWPTKEKLAQITVIVLIVIFAAAILLSLAGQGSRYILEKIGFYDQTPETTAEVTSAPTATPIPTDASDVNITVDTTAAAETTAAN